MKTSNQKKYLKGIAVLCLLAALNVSAQQRGGGGGGFGGFGGGGFGGGGFGGGGFGGNGGGGQRTGQQQQYTPNNQVGGATFSIDDSGNIVAIADEDTMQRIREVVASLDRPKPQVLIKVVFLEVAHNNSLDIGIEGAYGHGFGNSMTSAVANAFGVSPVGSVFSPTNLNSVGQQIGNFAPNPPGAGLYQVLGSDFQATLRAIATAGKAQLLSRPSILARDRQPATIVMGQTVPLITSVSYTGVAGNPVNNVTYTDVGIILRVTPYITPDGLVQMIISPETSSIDTTFSVPISPGVNAPVINVRSADTVAITADGQTVVIGGLMASAKTANDSKIPFLGDIPLLGMLFKRQQRSGTKTELLIFLTPHIVQTPGQMTALTQREQGSHPLIKKSVSEEDLDRFLERIPAKSDK